jgi:hypothetical protein
LDGGKSLRDDGPANGLIYKYLWKIGNKDPKYIGTTWLTAMLTAVWQQFFVIWSERNATLHGKTHVPWQEALRRKITHQIHQWFSCKDQLLQTDYIDILEANFGPTIESADVWIAKDPTHASLNWLQMYSPSLLNGIKVANASAL